jgi:hypothetical protein
MFSVCASAAKPYEGRAVVYCKRYDNQHSWCCFECKSTKCAHCKTANNNPLCVLPDVRPAAVAREPYQIRPIPIDSTQLGEHHRAAMSKLAHHGIGSVHDGIRSGSPTFTPRHCATEESCSIPGCVCSIHCDECKRPWKEAAVVDECEVRSSAS